MLPIEFGQPETLNNEIRRMQKVIGAIIEHGKRIEAGTVPPNKQRVMYYVFVCKKQGWIL